VVTAPQVFGLALDSTEMQDLILVAEKDTSIFTSFNQESASLFCKGIPVHGT